MSIIDSNLEIYWQINSDQVGVDFKENNNKISYFNKNTLNSEGAHWIIADNQMQEIDSLICTSGLTDYHDIRMVDNGNYILQSYDSLYVNMSNLVEGGVPGAIVKGILRLQEFDSDHNLILDWFAFDHLDIADYTNLNLTIPQITWIKVLQFQKTASHKIHCLILTSIDSINSSQSSNLYKADSISNFNLSSKRFRPLYKIVQNLIRQFPFSNKRTPSFPSFCAKAEIYGLQHDFH